MRDERSARTLSSFIPHPSSLIPPATAVFFLLHFPCPRRPQECVLDGGCYPPPCPVEPGLSSIPGLAPAWHSDRPSDSRPFLPSSYRRGGGAKGSRPRKQIP